MINLHSIDLWQQATVIIDAMIAAVLGSLIGWERDRAGKSAGPRTMALVGSASAAIVAHTAESIPPLRPRTTDLKPFF